MTESPSDRAERIAAARRDGRLGSAARQLQEELDRNGISLAEGLKDPHIRGLADAATSYAQARLPGPENPVPKTADEEMNFAEDLELFYDEWDDKK
jgi:hypothetical protein